MLEGFHTLTQCFDARGELQRLALGVNTAKCDATRQSLDRHVLDVGRTAVMSVCFVRKTLDSE